MIPIRKMVDGKRWMKKTCHIQNDPNLREIRPFQIQIYDVVISNIRQIFYSIGIIQNRYCFFYAAFPWCKVRTTIKYTNFSIYRRFSPHDTFLYESSSATLKIEILGVRVMVFNAIFKFYWWGKTQCPEITLTCRKSLTNVIT